MAWTWDPEKDRANKRKHGIGFETARLVFDDPLALSRIDAAVREEERWQTVGAIGDATVLVVHTALEETDDGEVDGRIISARKATRHERKAYEEGEF
ncbi:MAG: BrnT family toxin [Micropepsaceae bacterium]